MHEMTSPSILRAYLQQWIFNTLHLLKDPNRPKKNIS